MEYRIEHDLLGEKKIPMDAYWGIHTARAMENFPYSTARTDMALVKAIVIVKKACTLANLETKHLAKDKAQAIVQACDEALAGKFDDSFIINSLAGGAGTSVNMNINEVLANRALEILGRAKGDYEFLHPNDDVNMHQSTNDVFPTALKVAAISKLKLLSASIATLQGEFQRKEKEFSDIVTVGRSELRSAVPMVLGMQFASFANVLERDRWRTFKCEERLRVVNLGGTVIGTGLGAPRDYIFLAVEKLRELTGLGLSRAEFLLDATANQDAASEAAGIIKVYAGDLIKIANDLRLLSAFGDIILKAVQAGSSQVAGKVNPVLPESIIQAAIMAAGRCDIVMDCVSRGSLQINEFMPLIADSLLSALTLLSEASNILTICVRDIAADKDVCRKYLENCPGIITALIPEIGYEKATTLTQEYKDIKDNTVYGFLSEKLGKETVDRFISAQKLSALGH